LPATNPTSGIGLLIGTLAGGTNIDVQLTAAEQKGDAHIIAEPSIVTSNGVPAKIRSGETLLIKTTGDLNIGAAGVSGDTGLHQIDTGVMLTVTPQISGGNYVKLKINAETSQPDFSRMVDNIPVIIDNTASTEVLVLDGQTTIIGGLSKFTGSDTERRVPFLSKIPILGNLFKSRQKSKRNTELMIFIRPIILRPLENMMLDNAEFERSDEMKAQALVTPLNEKKEKKRMEKIDAEGGDTRGRSRNPHLRYRYSH
jgi:type IV pilus assembly protein PilQ